MKRSLIIILAALGSFFALGDRYVISVLYTHFMYNYGVSTKVVFSLIFSSFYIGYTLTQIPGGWLSEKFGPARISGISLIIWSIFLLLLSIVRSFDEAVLIAFLMGLSQGPIFPSVMYLARLYYEDDEYAKATGYVSFLGDVSPALVPLIAFALIGINSQLIVPVGFFSLTGSAVGITLILLKTNFKRKTSENRWNMLLNYRLWIFGVTFFLYDFLFYVFLTWFPSFLNERYNIGEGNFLFYSTPWLFMGLAAILSGYLLDRMKNDAIITIASYVVIFVSMVSIAYFRNAYIFLAMVTIMLSLLNPILLASWRFSTRLGGKNNSALIGGWMNTWGNIGGIVAPFATASLMIVVGLNDMFLFFSALPLAAGLLWIFLKVKPNG